MEDISCLSQFTCKVQPMDFAGQGPRIIARIDHVPVRGPLALVARLTNIVGAVAEAAIVQLACI